MPLQDGRKFLTFNDGAQESQDPEVNPGIISSLTNAEFDHDLALSKRPGLTQLGTNVLKTGMMANALVGTGNALAVRVGDALLPVLVSSDVTTGIAGITPSSTSLPQHCHPLEVSNVISASAGIVTAPGAVSSAVSASGTTAGVAFQYGDGTNTNVRVLIIDIPRRTVLMSYDWDSHNTPRILYLSNKFYVYAYNSGVTQVDVLAVNYAAQTVAATSAFVSLATTAIPTFDIVADSTGGFLLTYTVVTTARLRVARTTNGTSIATSFEEAGITNALGAAVTRVNGNQVCVAYGTVSSPTNGVTLLTYDSALTGQTTAATQVLPNTGAPYLYVDVFWPSGSSFVYVAGTTTGNVTDYLAVNYTTHALAVLRQLTDHDLISRLWGMPSSTDAAYTGSELERAFAVVCAADQSGAPKLPTAVVAMLGSDETYPNALQFGQPTGVEFSPTGTFAVSMALTDSADPKQQPLGRPVLGTNGYYWATLRLTQAAAGGISAQYHVDLLCFSKPSSTVAPNKVAVGDSAFISGGLPLVYDGRSCVEPTPLETPAPPISITEGVGVLPTGTYNFCCLWTWESAQGVKYRGPVSSTFSHDISSGPHSLSFTITNNLASASAQAATRRVRLEVYRTELGGATFHLDSVVAGAYPGATLSVTSNTADATLANAEILYTNGGVLEAEAPPALTALTIHRDRLWGISAEDPHVLYFTKVKEQGFGFEWNAELTVRLEEAEPVALGTLDDKLLVFTADHCYAITGEGPDATGLGAFNPPERVGVSCGATGKNAALTTPFGVFVHSPSGFKLIGRDLQVSDVGNTLDTAPGSVSIQAAHNFEELQQAWFAIAGSNTVVVFEYERGRIRWHKVSLAGQHSVASTIVDIDSYLGLPAVLTQTADSLAAPIYAVWTWDESHAADGDRTTFTPMTIQTGWFRPEGEGLGDDRFRVLHVYGRKGTNACNLVVDIELQGEQRSVGTKETVTFNATQMAITDPVHLQHRLKRQRGVAARVTLTQDATGLGSKDLDGFVPFGIEWEYGARGKTTRVGATSKP